jgi:prepilin peptidase CpaA
MNLSSPPPAIVVVLLAVVFTAAIFDLRSSRIPNWISVTGALLGFGLNAFLADSAWGAWFALKGFLLGFGVNLVLYILHARGAGDVKLMAAIGALVGPGNWFAIFVITALLGGIMALILVVAKGRLKHTLFNVGYILSEMKRGRAAHLGREELDVKSDKASRLPAGAVIAVGCIFYLAVSAHYAR